MPPALRTLLLGKPKNFALHGQVAQTAARTIEKALIDACHAGALEPPTAVFVPLEEFTNQTISEKSRAHCASFGTVFISKEPADGVLLHGVRRAGALTLADCLGICLSEGSQLAVLHGGLKCLVRENDYENSIIIEAVRKHSFHPENTHAWMGGGIGPCCYGLDTISDRIPQEAASAPIRGPRKEKPYAVDLRTIARAQLLALGVPGEHITIDERCTSCFEDQGVSPYWSHVRGDRARNLLVAWLS